MNVLVFRRPPSRCTCGCTRINHPGAGKCRLCRCRRFELERVRRKTPPKEPAPAPRGEPRRSAREERAERDQEITRLRAAGMTQDKIAGEIGVSSRTVGRALKKGRAA